MNWISFVVAIQQKKDETKVDEERRVSWKALPWRPSTKQTNEDASDEKIAITALISFVVAIQQNKNEK